MLTAGQPEDGWLGNSVIVGDFDDDGNRDVAAAAPKDMVQGEMAGSVHVFFGPFDGGTPVELVLPNPEPILHGNFGQHLSVGDGNGDGIDDLYVSAIGNTAAGLPKAGQIYVYPGPVSPTSFLVVEDPNPDPNDVPSPRFGMHIDARDHLLAVGANRKDHSGLHDAGQGYVYPGPDFATVTLHNHPTPLDSDYMAFRVAIANVVGDPTLDVTFAALPSPFHPEPNPLALFVWDGTDLTGSPLVVRAHNRSGDHFANGLSTAQIVPGGYEELIVGDATYDANAGSVNDNTGRVVIYGDF